MEIEMRFIATFCDVIVLETKRLDVVTSDKAKSDFISSVSHELRSPLHGILGSAEVLAEHKLDGSAVTMIEQINSCSYALLDVINHLLDFADLKQQHVKRGAARSSNIGRVLAPSTTTAGDPSKDLTALSMNVLLNDLTESAVMSSVYSYHYNREHERRQQTLVILDVERMDNSSWHCQLATGAWRRICMNLVSNALKFTVKGHVRVSLKARFKAGARRRFDAVLSVTDSGKGMSEEYQRNHLFRHFSQEDTLSNGLGIGMHMVSRMVNAMGGRIEVSSSQKGTGTRITVTVPLEQQRDHGGPDVKQEGAAPSSLAGLKVGFVGRTQEFAATRSQDRVAVAWEMASSSIQKDLKFLGCELQRYPVGSDWPCDLAIVMESDWKDCLASIQEKQVLDTTRFPPILVICNNALTAQTLGASWSKDNSDTKVVVEHLGLPCGLKQLARSASSVLRRHKERMSLPVVEGQHRDAPIAVESLPIRESSPSELKDDSSMSSHSDSGVSDLTTPDLSESPPNAKSIHVPESAAESPPTASPQAEQPEIHNVLAGIPPQSPSSVDEPTPLAPKLPLLLLVDDNKINLKLLETFAKKRQYPYITAVDGQLALDAYVNGHKTSLSPDAASDSSVVSGIPTVILLDINMPVMDGYEAAQRIRAYEKKYRMVPAMIIAVTALGSEAAQAEAYGSGFNVFLSKPLKLKMLTKLLEEI
jgi:signal transduction histidine kinase/CheY-like chemotaxis protein